MEDASEGLAPRQRATRLVPATDVAESTSFRDHAPLCTKVATDRQSGHKVTTNTREDTAMTAPKTETNQQLLHLVFGGELETLDGTSFRDPNALDIVGIYPSYAEAHVAWKGVAQRSVDNALMRYFIVHMHRLLDPQKS